MNCFLQKKEKKMISIRKWEGLEKYGIRCLTGEACGLSMRLLCDLTEEGCKLLIEFFGGNINIKYDSNWNPGSVASILLPCSIFKDLVTYCLISREKCVSVICTDDGYVRGCTVKEGDRTDELRENGYKIDRVIIPRGTARDGLRHRHQMSGRIE
jgi:hypothetical protein